MWTQNCLLLGLVGYGCIPVLIFFLPLYISSLFVSLDVWHLSCFVLLNSDRLYLLLIWGWGEGLLLFFHWLYNQTYCLNFAWYKANQVPPTHTPSDSTVLFTGKGFLACTFKQWCTVTFRNPIEGFHLNVFTTMLNNAYMYQNVTW